MIREMRRGTLMSCLLCHTFELQRIIYIEKGCNTYISKMIIIHNIICIQPPHIYIKDTVIHTCTLQFVCLLSMLFTNYVIKQYGVHQGGAVLNGIITNYWVQSKFEVIKDLKFEQESKPISIYETKCFRSEDISFIISQMRRAKMYFPL